MPKNKSYLDPEHWPTDADGHKVPGFYEQDGKLVAVLKVGQKLAAAVVAEREWRIGAAYDRLLAGSELTDVPVEGRGTITLKPHPMAEEFPVTDRGMFVRLVDDVEKRGFDTPIDLTAEDLILDGRTRAAVAWITGIEVPVRPFEGDEEEATSKAVAANLLRRHLTTVAQAALALKYLAPALSKEAAKRERGGVKVEGSMRVADQLAMMADGAFSPSTVKRLKGIEEAPQTFARVIDGELTAVPDIKEAMEDEIRRDMTPAQKAARTRQQQASAPKKRATTAKVRTPEVLLGLIDELLAEVETNVRDGKYDAAATNEIANGAHEQLDQLNEILGLITAAGAQLTSVGDEPQDEPAAS